MTAIAARLAGDLYKQQPLKTPRIVPVHPLPAPTDTGIIGGTGSHDVKPQRYFRQANYLLSPGSNS
jgi:hypothetical protein